MKKRCLELRFYEAIGVREFKDTLMVFKEFKELRDGFGDEKRHTIYHFPSDHRVKRKELKWHLESVKTSLGVKKVFAIPMLMSASGIIAIQLMRENPNEAILTLAAAYGLGVVYTLMSQRYLQLRLEHTIENTKKKKHDNAVEL